MYFSFKNMNVPRKLAAQKYDFKNLPCIITILIIFSFDYNKSRKPKLFEKIDNSIIKC